MHFNILKINWTESFKANPQVLLMVVLGSALSMGWQNKLFRMVKADRKFNLRHGGIVKSIDQNNGNYIVQLEVHFLY